MSETIARQLWDKYRSLSEEEFAREEVGIGSDKRSLEHVAAGVYGAKGLAHGEPFLRAFSEALSMGCLSLRSIRHQCDEGLLTSVWSQSPVPFALTGAPERSLHMAREALEAREWHRIQASRDLHLDASRHDSGVFEYKYWRWKGYLVRYGCNPGARSAVTQRRTSAAEQRPALVLVHGFGASADQWHDLIRRLPHYDVWAIGRSWVRVRREHVCMRVCLRARVCVFVRERGRERERGGGGGEREKESVCACV